MHSLNDVLGIPVDHWFHAIEAVALVLALGHGFNLSRINKDLKKVLKTLPTQPLYEFPHYLHRIAEMVNAAKRSIFICCDQPAYGSFSNQVAFLKYGNSLRDKIGLDDNIEVRLCCMDLLRRQENTIAQFKKEDWDQFKKKNRKLLVSYLKKHAHDVSVEKLSYEAFTKLIVEEDTNSLKGEFGGAHIEQLDRQPPVYFWYIDDAMVFVIPSEPRLTENGFYTRDPHLINGILDLTQRYTNQYFPRAGAPHELTRET